MSSSDLRKYVNSSHDGDEDFIVQCWAEATELVRRYVRGVEHFEFMHSEVFQRAVLEVGAELFHRRNAPGGITQFATIDGTAPVRMARDPMVGAYPILDPFLPGAIA